jgi:hypothetical protein
MTDDVEPENQATSSTVDVRLSSVLVTLALVAAIALVIFAIAVMIGLVT